MNRTATINKIKQHEPYFLEADKQKKGYICPKCNNGTGKSGDGIRLIPNSPNRQYKCFRCDLVEDIIGLYMIKYNLNFNEALEALAEHFNYDLEGTDYKNSSNTKTRVKPVDPTPTLTASADTSIIKRANTQTIKEASENIDNTNYLQARGISKETSKKYKIGYLENWTHPTNSKVRAGKVLIIPTSENTYNARVLDEHAGMRYLKAGESQLFNIQALEQSDTPVFIVEGEIDALSLLELGAEAISLGGTTGGNKLIQAISELNKDDLPDIYIALDNDEAGLEASKKLYKALSELNIPAQEISLYDEYKDANEALVKDRQALANKVTKYKEADIESLRREEYENSKSNLKYLNDFLLEIQRINNPPISTGYEKLDKVLGGGLYAGLIAIGAISSLGKTTFTLQMADQIAQQGKDVLIVSLEMSRNELISKSISRHTLLESQSEGLSIFANPDNQTIGYAKTALGITDIRRYSNYTDKEKEIIKQAIAKYAGYASNVYMHESIGQTSASDIRELVEEHKNITGNAPVVILDYLQIIGQEENSKYIGDKQKTDEAVMLLKQLSRDYKTPVIIISSFNRDNYTKKVNMTAFKESGGIEYSTDVLIGLQYAKISDEDGGKFDLIEESKKNPREIELVMLKNRNGTIGDELRYYYYPAFNYFQEAEKREKHF